MIHFSRAEGAEWEPWPSMARPTPPAESDMPLAPCGHGHHGCVDWRGVHFHAIRFGDRVWDAVNGWRRPITPTTKGATMENNLDFGRALDALKAGKNVARAGWNGKGMFIYLNKGSFDHGLLGFKPGENPGPDHPSTMDGISLGLFSSGDKGTVTRLPNINMRSATGSTVTGWLASQTDMLAEDWEIIA